LPSTATPYVRRKFGGALQSDVEPHEGRQAIGLPLLSQGRPGGAGSAPPNRPVPDRARSGRAEFQCHRVRCPVSVSRHRTR